MSAEHRPLTSTDLLPTGPLLRLGRQVFVHDTLDSTNAWLLREAATAGDGAVAWAEFQTAGRGRLGRRWEAPRGSSVLLSVLLHEPADSALLVRGGLLAAVAACEAVEHATHCTAGLRWPNDVMVHGRKLGGVLVESCFRGPQSSALRAGPRSSASHPPVDGRAVVIGVGLNCYQQRGHFPADLVDQATSLEQESLQPVERAAVAASLLARLDAWLSQLATPTTGWPALQAAWRVRCNDLGTRVTLQHDNRTFHGTALEVTADGDLLVQLDEGGRRSFAAASTTRAF